MTILWGSKTLKRNAGFAADYCAVCRIPAVMQITEHRQVRTIYFVPIGHGKPFELWASCPECTSRFVRPVGYYTMIATESGSLEQVAGWTNPAVMHGAEFRAKIEVAAKSGKADPQDRLAIFREIIGSLEADAVNRQVSGRYESTTALIAVLAIFGAAIAAVLAVTAPPVWAWGLGSVSLPALVWLVYRIVRGQSRYRARLVEQRIARALTPFSPTDDELHTVRASLVDAGSTVAMGLNIRRLRELMVLGNSAESKRASGATKHASSLRQNRDPGVSARKT